MKIYFFPNFIVHDKYAEIPLSAVMCCGELLGGGGWWDAEGRTGFVRTHVS